MSGDDIMEAGTEDREEGVIAQDIPEDSAEDGSKTDFPGGEIPETNEGERPRDAGDENGDDSLPAPSKTWRERLRERYLAYREKSIAFKAMLSVLAGCLAAIMVIVAGIASGRLVSVTLLRAVIGFFVAGGFMLSLSFWLEKFGIPMYLSRHEELGLSWMNEAEEPERTAPAESGAPDGDEAVPESMGAEGAEVIS